MTEPYEAEVSGEPNVPLTSEPEEVLEDRESDLDVATDGDEMGGSSGSIVEQLTKERDEYRDAAQRLQAEFENFKKRVVRSDQERMTRAESRLVTELLPVLDAIDLAFTHEEDNASLLQVSQALMDSLSKLGLGRIGVIDEAFDPNRHEAVQHEAGEGDQRILEVFRPGYEWKGIVIRPAMVKVLGS